MFLSANRNMDLRGQSERAPIPGNVGYNRSGGGSRSSGGGGRNGRLNKERLWHRLCIQTHVHALITPSQHIGDPSSTTGSIPCGRRYPHYKNTGVYFYQTLVSISF